MVSTTTTALSAIAVDAHKGEPHNIQQQRTRRIRGFSPRAMASYSSVSTTVSPFETGAPTVVVHPVPKPSFAAVGYMVLLGDTVRGIFFPTLWPLVSSFGGGKAAQGVIVAARATVPQSRPGLRGAFSLCSVAAAAPSPRRRRGVGAAPSPASSQSGLVFESCGDPREIGSPWAASSSRRATAATRRTTATGAS